MNLMGRGDAPAASPAGPSALAGLAGQSHLLNWADKTFGQGLTSLTKGETHAIHSSFPSTRSTIIGRVWYAEILRWS